MNLKYYKNELVAGLIGALATLPQAVAYGLIAVSPLGPEWAVFGITASVVSAILFGLISGSLGSNPFLISGPRAVTALVLAVAIEAGIERGFSNESAVLFAFSGIFVAGLLQLLAGILGMGRIVSYVPSPVLAGFVTASALMVALSSIPIMFDLPHLSLYEILQLNHIPLNTWAIWIGGITIAAIFFLEKRMRWIPSALAGLILGTLVYFIGVHFFTLPNGPQIGMIEVSGLLERGLMLTPNMDWTLLMEQMDIPLLAGVSIALLASFDTVLTGTAIETEVMAHSDANHDLKIHGVGNMLMGVFGLLPGSGAHSRSSAVIQAGATSRWANIFSALVFLLLIVGLTSIVAVMPLWATSGMLIATAVQAIDKPTLQKIWKILGQQIPYRRVLVGDVLVAFAVILIAIVFDLIMAVGVGMLISIGLFILGMGRNPIRRRYCAQMVHSKVQRPAHHTDFLKQQGHRVAVIELQGALFFGSVAKLQHEAKACLERGAEYLILDFRHLNSIDSSGAVLLLKLHKMFRENGGGLLISCIEVERRSEGNPPDKASKPIERRDKNRQVSQRLRWIWLNLTANDVIASLGEQRIFDDTDSALSHCEDILLKEQAQHQNLKSLGIKKSGLFAGLSAQEIAVLGQYTQRQRFRSDQVVFAQGETGDQIYYLVKGRMDVMINIPGSARKRRISALTEGTLFGEMGLLDGSPRSATIKASRDSICFSIDALKLSELEVQRPHIAFTLMRNMNQIFAQRLRVASDIISELER